MSNLDMVLHVVEHARRWRISSDRLEYFSCSPRQTVLMLPYGEVGLFIEWARHLDQRSITVRRQNNCPGAIEVSGAVLSGHPITVLVELDQQHLRRAHLLGAVSLGELERLTLTAVTA